MKKSDQIIKRVFDLVLSFMGILLFWWLILVLIFIASIDTKQNGLFKQIRVGKKGSLFYIYKIRSMQFHSRINSAESLNNQPKISKIGKFLRKSKLDELPQLLNILLGQMSFVGPRPDVVGFADKLQGKDRIILSVKPGITGVASIYFRNEEQILAKQRHPEVYNRNVIWPKKVELNKEYIENYSFIKDIKIIIRTLFNR